MKTNLSKSFLFSDLLMSQCVEARSAVPDSRRSPRYPYFHSAEIMTSDGRRVASFSRDISEEGSGLLHAVALPLGAADIRRLVPQQGKNREPLRVHIAWCRRSIGPWYFSDGEFV